MRRGVLLLLPLLAAACRVEEEITVHADGSGKYVFTMGVPKKPGQGPPNWPDPVDFSRKWGGMVAWTEPTHHEDERYRYAVYTGYFEDVGRLRLWKDKYGPDVPEEERKADVVYEYVEKNGECRLTIRAANPEPFKLPEAGRPIPDARYHGKVTVPGEIVEATGVTRREGKTVEVVVDKALLQGVLDGKDEAIAGLDEANKPMVIRWKRGKPAEEALKAFRREMEAAKERWKALREE